MKNDEFLKNKILEMLKEGQFSGEEKANVIPIALAYSHLTQKERQLFHSTIELVETYGE